MDSSASWIEIREKLIGLGDKSARKSYYPELRTKIAELEDAHQRLKRTEQNLRVIFNTVSEAILIHDVNGNIKEVNDSMLEMFEVTREESTLSPLQAYSADEAPLEELNNMCERACTEHIPPFEWKAKRMRSEQTFDAELAIRPIVWNGSAALVTSARDISPRKQLEEMLLQSQKMDAVGQLAGGVAHDFNNMLTGIFSFAELILTECPADSPLARWTQTILEISKRASDRTRQLLDFSRTSRMEHNLVDIHAAIANTVEILEHSIDKRIEIVTEIGATNFFVSGDSSQIQNALLNLAINARDALPNGGRISLITKNEPDAQSTTFQHISQTPSIYIQVRDNGHGIRPEFLARIFEPFFTTKDIGKGTGLGLATTYSCIQHHGGTIEVQSTVGIGSTFTICLPLVSTMPQEKSHLAEPVLAGDEKILVVDDEEIVRTAVEQILSRRGFVVTTASCGEEALRLFRSDPLKFDAVVLDVVMPEMTGEELFHKLREINPDIPALFASGYPRGAFVDQDEKFSKSAFIQKPYRADSLIRSLRAIIAPSCEHA